MDRPWKVQVKAAALSADGKLALLGYQHDNRHLGVDLTLWDVATGKKLRAMHGHAGDVRFVAFLPDGKRALSAGGDGIVKLHDLGSGRLLQSIRANPGGRGVWPALSPDGKLVLTLGDESILNLWGVDSGDLVRTFKEPAAGDISLAISPGNLWALSGCYPGPTSGGGRDLP
jgi:WD40 repeat protein